MAPNPLPNLTWSEQIATIIYLIQAYIILVRAIDQMGRSLTTNTHRYTAPGRLSIRWMRHFGASSARHATLLNPNFPLPEIMG
jgi:hypothetical protein